MKNILFTGGRAPATLDLVRLFNKKNYNVFIAETFKNNIMQSVTSFAARPDSKVKSVGKLKAFAPDYYGQLFLQLISYNGSFENICNPQTDVEYILLKSCLFPILEAITWIHAENKGYNNTLCNYMFNYPDFEKNYKDTTFYVFDMINSTRTKFREFDYPTFKEYYLTKFNLNPYGTLSAYTTNLDDAGVVFDGNSGSIVSGIAMGNPGNPNQNGKLPNSSMQG